ncbi:AMP-binding protein [Lawsonia intracellularis]|uniref:O-succinylbenzoic acid--CoA ligase n=1 Tax=Lawsonia intracellularis (strain PHE/MN1-00) TaxID=363253 RepID=Q1MQ67_LAWIP|nr:AMP-binding protein [Lawsonia intracellularis]AGC50231.1 O-succinylbenzoic acid--CoA ligase [Lawsonia intracellularis N343]KAA0204658.1 O-succinylbenzoic acid--CoA ligase [Lawsonia intracellularis]MBZ3892672.1 AMP-binding protein [Lawsonia intracellularis]OMQ03077.1 O-succinylbenzoic acid--CoA ligase [Lawsonia intracellularis]RBN35014.1 O-succinylbenzoic acid--CoA ligase [Lawsonia intracellularis]
MFEFNIERQSILINGEKFSKTNILKNNKNEKIQSELFQFLKEWFNQSITIQVSTSGSTGKPKTLHVKKTCMLQSAYLTCSFLGLKPNDTALLCMPLKYIGAKMVVVRSLLAGLNLLYVTPSSRPLKQIKSSPTFAAMTPMQVCTTLEYKKDTTYLKNIKHLIIGGGSIDTSLSKKLADFPHAVWSTYGMTETLSHIALRKLNGVNASEWYTPFKSIKVSLSPEGTLVITAPNICKKPLVTNDIAEVNECGNFRIIGRKDNIINSGGIKIQIELVENLLKKFILQPFIITSIPDHKFGELVVILVEKKVCDYLAICKANLPLYWCPKHVIQVQKLPKTDTDKVNRAKAKELAYKIFSQQFNSK